MRLQKLKSFSGNESGGMTVFGMFLIVACMITAGLAVDVMNGVKTRTQLQTAADSAAHAALMAHTYGQTEDEAKQIGAAVANAILARSGVSETLQTQDIHFGEWKASSQVFDRSSSANSAVMVSAQRIAARKTAMATSFLSFIGVSKFDVVSESVFETYVPACTREGLFAYGRIDMQSGNQFLNGFCIHSQKHVEVNNGNTFANNVIVSMPNKNNIVLPSSGYTHNGGLQQALRSGSYAIPILYRAEQIIQNMDNPSSPWFVGDYINIDPLTGLPQEVTLHKNDKLSEVWVPGAVHRRTCTSKNGSVKFDKGTFNKGVLITNCLVDIAGVTLKDIAIGTTNTDPDKSVSASANPILGLDDGCKDGGGVQIVTMGGIDFAAGLSAYGVQMLALHNVEFSSNTNGIEGISIVAGGEIDTQSNGILGFCNGAGLGNNWLADYFRMAT